MQDGFLKIAVATPHVTVAGCERNAEAVKACIERARADGARLVALPELCITGYSCGDLFRLDALLEAAMRALESVRQFTEGSDMLVALGAPLSVQSGLYNCAVLLQNGHVLGVIPKTHLPNYGEFYEKRVFTPAPEQNQMISLLGEQVPFGNRLIFACRELPELVIGAEVCEDMWSPLPPSTWLCMAGATLILNLSASDEAVSKPDQRRMLIRSQSSRLNCAYAFVSAGDGESTTDVVFSGHDMIYENGELLAEAPPFGCGYAISEIDLAFLARERRRMTRQNEGGVQQVSFSLTPLPTALTRCYWKKPFVPDDPAERADRCRQVLAIQARGLLQRVRHIHAKKLVLGVSGGADSTLALLVCAETLRLLNRPATDILAVTMPCFGTSHRTRSNAELLCAALGIPVRTVDISAAVRQHLSDLGHPLDLMDTAYENAQARERTQVLMDLANMEGGLVVGTGDLSELALGFATYNGDHMSMYGVNADVPKTLIRAMLLHRADVCGNEALACVLRDVVSTPVSPELLPGRDGAIAQVTEELVGPYELHDFYLYHMLRRGEPREKILRLARCAFADEYDADTIARWFSVFCKRFFSNQFKRSCMPDGPRVGSVALSPRGDWRMPSDAVPDSFLN